MLVNDDLFDMLIMGVGIELTRLCVFSSTTEAASSGQGIATQ
jgi:hypothetical protein